MCPSTRSAGVKDSEIPKACRKKGRQANEQNQVSNRILLGGKLSRKGAFHPWRNDGKLVRSGRLTHRFGKFSGIALGSRESKSYPDFIRSSAQRLVMHTNEHFPEDAEKYRNYGPIIKLAAIAGNGVCTNEAV